MFDDTRRSRKVLGGIAGVNLVLALAVSAGALPHPGGDDAAKTTTVASASIADEASSSTEPPLDVVPAAEDVTTTTVAPTTVPATVAPKATVTTPPTTPPSTTTKLAAATQPTAPRVTAPVAAVPVSVARRTPTSAEVQQAIATLPQYVRSLLTPSPAQVAQLGDRVCSMFDQGQTFAQVKATGLQMVTQVPLTTVLPGGADWVVRTAVTLYCPGHAAKLV